MSDWRDKLRHTIARLKLHASLTGAAAVGLLAASVVISNGDSPARWFMLAMLVCEVVILAQTVHLLFDAALFRLALTHDNEQAGLAAIDRTLDSMGLRKMPAQPPLLPQRLTGTARLLRRQYVLLAMSAAIFGFALFGCGRV